MSTPTIETPPIDYYAYVGRRYSEIIAELHNYDPRTHAISLDIDETVLSDLSELPCEFSKYHNIEQGTNILHVRPAIPRAAAFVDAIAGMGFKIYFITGRPTHRRAKTIEDIRAFPCEKLYMCDMIDVAAFKKALRLRHNCIGIGDQLHDVDDAKFLIHNPYY